MSTASHMQQVNVTGVNSLPPNKQAPTQNHKPTHNGTTSSPPNINTQNPQQTTTVQPPATNGVVTNGSAGSGGGEPNGGTPPVNNAPKYGTLVPNRVFVGGISANTTEVELAQLFSAYGTVKATKIISDRAGVSKGYGFVTFESEEEAKRLQRESDNIMLRERRLNIAPAIKKQPFNRGFDVSSPPPQSAAAVAAAAAGQTQFYYAAAAAAAGQVPYAAYQNGMAYYTPAPPPPPQSAGGAAAAAAASADLGAAQPLYQAPPVYATPTAAPPAAPYPMPMYPPQPLFVQHQYPYQPIPYDLQQYYGGGGGGGGSAGGGYGLYGSGGGGSGGSGGTASNTMASGHQQQCAPGVQSAGSGSQGGNSGVGAGQGPGGSASPTRQAYTAAYHQHIAQAYAATTATDAGMYYNVPMYNLALDPATGIYTAESIDVPTGSIPEVNHQKVKYHGPLDLCQPDHNINKITNMFGFKPMHIDPPLIYSNNVPMQPYHSIRHNGHSTPPETPPDQFHTSKTPNYLPRNSHASTKGIHRTSRGRCDSNYCRTWSKRRRDQRLDQSSASSQRTDSNSSASATVDENLNERKDTPPPTLLDQSNHLTDLQVPHHQHSGTYFQPSPNSGGGRRHRRNNPRRQANVGNSASQPAAHEVGAGDAPLPDHSDMCSKMDNLKL